MKSLLTQSKIETLSICIIHELAGAERRGCGWKWLKLKFLVSSEHQPIWAVTHKVCSCYCKKPKVIWWTHLAACFGFKDTAGRVPLKAALWDGALSRSQRDHWQSQLSLLAQQNIVPGYIVTPLRPCWNCIRWSLLSNCHWFVAISHVSINIFLCACWSIT